MRTESSVRYIFDEYAFIEPTSPYVDLQGRPVKKTPWSNPYDFDEYVEWKGDYHERDSADYSDRLYQWDTAKYKRCWKEVFGTDSENVFSPRDPGLINKFLNLYFEKEVILTAITRGCNVSSGFPYYIYFYREV